MCSKFISWLRRSRAEDGQAMVMVALTLVVLLGFGAFAVDLGHVAVQKSDLQNAADAAALAGAANLPSGTAESIATEYAKKNGMKDSEVDATKLSNTEIKVECTRQVDYYFAGVLGFESTEVKAVAVAEKDSSPWAGESLPFINLGFDYTTTDPGAWTQVAPGIKGTITDFYTKGSGDDIYFEVDYANGITIKKGYADGVKGLDDSKLKDGLEIVIKPEDMSVKVVYLFSIRADYIQNPTKKITVTRGGKTTTTTIANIKNDDIIAPNQLVLIQCLFIDCKWSNQHDFILTYLNNVYDLGNVSTHVVTKKPIPDLPDFPTDNISTSSDAGARLIQ